MGGDSMKRGDPNSSISPNSRQAKKKRSGVVDFTDSLTKTVAAQLCEDAGFQGFHLSALAALSDVAVRYIREIGRNASSYANSANRSECNAFDVIQGLEDLGTAHGFPGASDVHRCVSSSGVVREVEHYVEEAKEIQFAYSVPRFPVVMKRELLCPSFAQAGMKPPAEHIPPWLPVFPDSEAFGSVGLESEKVVQNGEGSVEAVLVEKDNENLQQKMISVASEPSNALAPAFQNGEVNVGDVLVEKEADGVRPLSDWQQKMICVTSEPSDALKEKSSSERDPFLTPTVQNGEGKVEDVLVEKMADGVRSLADLQQKVTVSEPPVAVSFGDAINLQQKITATQPSLMVNFSDAANLQQEMTVSEPSVAVNSKDAANRKQSLEGNLSLAPPVQNEEGKVRGVLVERDTGGGGVRPLASLLQKKSLSEPSVAVNFRDAAHRKRSLVCNPFLAPPIQIGEKEGISPVVIPHKRWDEPALHANDRGASHNHISGSDTFAPAIEGLNNGSKVDPEDGKQDAVPLNKSSAVKLRFSDVRKSFHRGVILQKHEDLKTIFWFANDETEDENKRRAEQIPKESLESTGSLVN